VWQCKNPSNPVSKCTCFTATFFAAASVCKADGLFQLLKQTKHCLDVPIMSADKLGEGGRHPYLSPADMFKEMANRKMTGVLTGTPTLKDGERLLLEYWLRFGALYPNHQAYAIARKNGFMKSIPILLHGDEGTSKKKQAVMILSYAGVLGKGTRKARKTIVKTKERVTSSKGGVNIWGNSLATRFLFTCIYKKQYAGRDSGENLQKYFDLWSKQMLRVMEDGFVDNGSTYYPIVVGTKGDWPYLHKSALLLRSFFNAPKHANTKGPEKGICHRCGAGLPGLPYEDVYERPAWLGSIGLQGAFKYEPAFLQLPHDPDFPANFWLQDIWHGWHLGLGKAWSAACCVLCNDFIAPGSNVEKRFDWLTADFRSWAKTNKISLHISEISEKTLSWNSRAEVPSGSWSKGSQTTNVCLWLEDLLFRPEYRELVSSNLQLRLAAT
jgi:hypothetical protein